MKYRLVKLMLSLSLVALSAPLANAGMAGASPNSNPESGADPNAERYNNYNGRKANQVKKISSAVPQGTLSAPSTNTINNGSEVAQKSQKSGSAMNMMAAAALMAACLAPKPPAMALCAMGAMAAMQGGHDSGAADLSGLTGLESTENVQPRSNDPTGASGFNDSNLAAGFNELKKAGYKVSEKGFTSPDGTYTSGNSLSTPAGMAAAGMDADSIKAAQKVNDMITAEAGKSGPSVSGVAVDTGGAGGGSEGVAEGESDSVSAVTFANPFALGADDKNKLVAGKTVLFDGDPIGVSGQNIFEMVHVAYQGKRKGNHFIEEGATANASIRAPASIQPASLSAKPKPK